jgi:hypothetical protein
MRLQKRKNLQKISLFLPTAENPEQALTHFLMDSDSLLHTRKKKVDPVNRTGSGLLGASVAPVQPR